MADNKQESKRQNKAANQADKQKIDFLAPLDQFTMPADNPIQEAGSRAAIHGDLEEAPNPVPKGKQTNK